MGDAVVHLVGRIAVVAFFAALGVALASTLYDLTDPPGAWHPVPDAGESDGARV